MRSRISQIEAARPVGNPRTAAVERQPESTVPAGWSMLGVTDRRPVALMRRSRSQCNYLFL
jgi:hypothetical protein